MRILWAWGLLLLCLIKIPRASCTSRAPVSPAAAPGSTSGGLDGSSPSSCTQTNDGRTSLGPAATCHHFSVARQALCIQRLWESGVIWKVGFQWTHGGDVDGTGVLAT